MPRGGGPAASVEMPPEEDLEEGQANADPGLGRILKLARAEWGWLFVGTLFLFLSLVPMLLMPLYFAKVVDDITTDKPADERKAKVSADLTQLALLLLMGGLTTVFRAFIFNGAGERVVARLRIQLFSAIITQEIGMFDRRKTGELLSRLSADTTSLQNVATSNVSMFIRGVSQTVFCVGLMFYTSWQLATLIVCVVPVAVIAISLYGRVLKRLSTKCSDALGHASDVAQQSVSNVRTVRSFAAELIEIAKYEKAVGNPDDDTNRFFCWYTRGDNSSYSAGIKKAFAGAVFAGFVTLVGLGAITGVIWFGAYQVIDGHLSQGNLVAFILYSVQIGASLGMMAGLMASLFSAKGASKRTFQLIDREPKIPVSGGIIPEQMDGHICFENVSFSYPSRLDIPVLRDFTVDIPKNATVAFVGSSGAGKSTVLSLLQRFYDVTDGRILIDNNPLDALDPSWVRRHFAFVQQEPALFGDTIAHNIAYGYSVRMGSPQAVPAQEMIEKAARDAYAHEFITGFTEGYDTLVGERGVRLSGGQKQRIAIARALLMDPRVLLLDEATSALDAESEAIVARAIEAAMVGRTVLIVAHRLSTVQRADRIVLIDNGSIVDMGTHNELLQRCDKYEELVRRQLTAPPLRQEKAAEVAVTMHNGETRAPAAPTVDGSLKQPLVS